MENRRRDPLNEPRRSDDEKLTKVCQRMNSFRSLYAIQVIPTFQHSQNIKYQIECIFNRIICEKLTSQHDIILLCHKNYI